ncbi:histidine kinase dimerization/phospho-acceptor domain-containing protein [Sphingomonas sp. HITSZ_GF]|uniref:histidine kinase dimerization/phospho-acceptor domain-containing protein n=1 Tax=Sphingomonas sp. HITSZ_GF TaxID=3037247 RepID=UPI00240E21D4|nr:histidine kinase dimerization/phospho-acceptor domain-containing protein [Sphingomonas sp. HITSZ_GF]MDG2532630.1 histidine kinase dimerization/phospho-acceptor domain-containing protein [Sphingomonas sp. HITSZ_GF]
MRFDDTLETVLASDLSTPYGVQSAWRQIVDLIGRRRAVAGSRAMGVLRSIRESVPLPVRAASARALESADPPPPLVRLFAMDELQVALPVLRSARMNSSEWIQLLPELAPAGRAVLRNRRDLSPVVRRALESFGPIDFVLPDETVKDVPVEVTASEPESVEEIVEAVAIDWSAVVDAGPAEVEPIDAGVPAPAEATEERVVADATSELPEPVSAAAESDERPIVYWSATAPARAAASSESLSALLARLPDPGAPVEPVAEMPVEASALDAGEAEPVESMTDTAVVAAPESAIPLPDAEDLSFVALAGLAPSLTAAAAQAVETPKIPIRPVQSGTDESVISAEPIARPEDRAQGLTMDYGDALVAQNAQRLAEGATQDDGTFEIAEVVARIDAFWRHREEAGAVEPPVLRPADEFRFETDAKGMIRWVDGVSRAPLVGVSLDSQATPGVAEASRVDGVAAGAFRRRAGFSNARLAVEGESDAAGDWLISAIPVFDPANGRFTGYRGTARRPRIDERAEPVRTAGPAMPADSLRQLVHELRTPTNAIAGFAEMIEAQMLGPVGDAYRDRAQVIRAQARELLGAIDDLDLAARIDSAALSLVPGQIALRPVLAAIIDDLAPLSELRGSVIALPIADLAVTGDRRAVERLLARLLATLVSASGQGERIGVHMAAEGADKVAITIDRPQALADYPGDQVLDIDDEREDATLLGTGFALRLARNLARELGGALVIGPESLTLRLPAAVNEQVGQAHLN